MRNISILFCLLSLSTGLLAQNLLPEIRRWKGKSENLIVKSDNPWISPSEKSGFETTPSYLETISWLKKLCDSSPLLSMKTVAVSNEGREIVMIIASKSKKISPQDLKNSGKTLLFAEAGIHAGEIDGKDAGLMLLRDIAFGGKASLLDKVNFIFIPILNVDGHEYTSPYNRINQRGPSNMGWRTNGQNLNLNRDFAKIDTREVKAVVGILNEYDPDLFVDLHVTDGIDYQYDVTMGSVGVHGYSPVSAKWMADYFYPSSYKKLSEMGHSPGPMMFAFNDIDYKDGIVEYCFGPSFSDNYADVRHIPSVLIENHSLKPYRQRVLGTYVFLESCLVILAEKGLELRQAKEKDKASRDSQVQSGFQIPQFKDAGLFGNATDKPGAGTPPPDTIEIMAISSYRSKSEISGGDYVHWTAEPVTIKTPIYRMNEPSGYFTLPKAYWIPAAWTEVIEKLKIHGIEMEVIKEPRKVDVEMYRINDPVFGKTPYENHMRVSGKPVLEKRTEVFGTGSVRISCDQDLAELIALLLEPGSSDSYLQWGFFLPIFNRTEYAEAYVLEPLAEKMLAESPELRTEFELKKSNDTIFAKDPDQILRWFYRKSPYYDERYLLYPVAREL